MVAPTAPRPWIGLAWVRLDAGDLATAEHHLDLAARLARDQPTTERTWALDSVDATRAVVRMRQGRMLEALNLIIGAPVYSQRWELCRHYVSICGSSASVQ